MCYIWSMFCILEKNDVIRHWIAAKKKVDTANWKRSNVWLFMEHWIEKSYGHVLRQIMEWMNDRTDELFYRNNTRSRILIFIYWLTAERKLTNCNKIGNVLWPYSMKFPLSRDTGDVSLKTWELISKIF